MRAVIAFVVSLVACAPDYSDTAFRCDNQHGCPDDQTCVYGRCRRGGAVGRVQCEATLCMESEQCCSSGGNTRCIPAGDDCDGTSALCDSLDDCQPGDQCCSQETSACGASCDEVLCTDDTDCPAGTDPFCCETGSSPWKRCRSTDC